MKVEAKVKIAYVLGHVKMSFSDKRFADERIIKNVISALYEFADKSIEEIKEDFEFEFTLTFEQNKEGYEIGISDMNKMDKKMAMYVVMVLYELLEEE